MTPNYKSDYYLGNYFATMAASRDRRRYSYWPSRLEVKYITETQRPDENRTHP